MIFKGRCLHCKHWVGDKGADLVQIQHVLNGCKSFKMQGRYHWRHEAVLNYIGSLLEKKGASGKERCFLQISKLLQQRFFSHCKKRYKKLKCDCRTVIVVHIEISKFFTLNRANFSN